ncbi:unnamed protein product [Parascedosporium putredinis]|uniref:Ureidoglycolate hydrolase n=1 Tax=Parascedosporium putredinis TaxID=1442378 RepID=A0A9P1M8J4_9PEZI|nr:unnamed protein product [Parascedosporium putredinis]CAI7990057.1 unnamed protein product [Parascedosporium putredinis]
MTLQVSIGRFSLTVPAQPLTASAFAPFGDLPFDAVSANQGTAIKYQHVSRPRNLYAQAPSAVPAEMVINMFEAASSRGTRTGEAREHRRADPDRRLPGVLHEDVRAEDIPSDDDQSLIEELASPPPAPTPPSPHQPRALSLADARAHQFPVTILERHPYTSQTFIPLSSPRRRAAYLVIVAPTISNTPDYPAMPTPRGRGLPGPGLPDLRRLRAFVASGDQAVTYGAGTWHAPMVVLGRAEDKVDFVVVQFANGVGREDCQEVVLQSEAPEGGGVHVEIRGIRS